MPDRETLPSLAKRPHCLYLWYVHGKAVCSEEHLSRSCAYPFWKCPAKASGSFLGDPQGAQQPVPPLCSDHQASDMISST